MSCTHLSCAFAFQHPEPATPAVASGRSGRNVARATHNTSHSVAEAPVRFLCLLGASPVPFLAIVSFNRSRKTRRSSRRVARRAAAEKTVLPLESWLVEAKLHEQLAKDAEEKFGQVPQQTARVIEDAVARIEKGARQCIAPSASAHPFGSAANGFGETSSDLDVLIAVEDEELCYYMSYINWHQREQRYEEAMRRNQAESLPVREVPRASAISNKAAMGCAVQQLADFLPSLGFQVVRLLPRARKPLVTLEDRTGEAGEVDVSINNRLPLCNTELLSSYCSLDWRVRPLVLLAKVWAKNHKVCGAHEGNLSSYSWTIMVIYFLQLMDLLPSLQSLSPASRSVTEVDYWGYEREFETGFLPAEDYLQGVKTGRIQGCKGEAKKSYSLAELLYGFFKFYAHEYSWGDEVVSIRAPERFEADGWFRMFGKPHPEPCIHVEDPIELRDLNIVMRRERLAQLKVEFDHARMLLEEGCNLEELLSSAPQPDVMMIMPTRRRLRNRHRSLRLPRPTPAAF